MSSPSFNPQLSPQFFQRSSSSRAGAAAAAGTARVAALTQLPPSPEFKSLSYEQQQQQQQQQQLNVPEMSLQADDGGTITGGGRSNIIPNNNSNNNNTNAANTTNTNSNGPSRRLRSVARYQAFHPKALACSNALTASSFNANEQEAVARRRRRRNVSSSKNATTTHAPKDPGSSSLGAVAGPQGIALFRLSRPHIPLLILSHASNSSSYLSSSYPSTGYRKRSISALAFQPINSRTLPSNPRSLYLAATRGSGVLIWDASGHSPNPLVGRLGMDQSYYSNNIYINSSSSSSAVPPSSTTHYSIASEIDTTITSIDWKPSTVSPLLATTTASSLSLWDLRVSPQASSGIGTRSYGIGGSSGVGGSSISDYSTFKPSLRFGTTRRSSHSNTISPLVQVACSSDSPECATIDASGIVRVFDIRMSERNRPSHGTGTNNHHHLPSPGSAVSVFAAHDSDGVGISYFPDAYGTGTSSTSSSGRWLTWGLDDPQSSAIVKIWSKSSNNNNNNAAVSSLSDHITSTAEDYWYTPPISSSTDRHGTIDKPLLPPSSSNNNNNNVNNKPTSMMFSPSSEYQPIAQCVRPNLACARVCASPIENSFVVVGLIHHDNNNDDGGGGGGGGNQHHLSANDQGGGGWWAELYKVPSPKEILNDETVGINNNNKGTTDTSDENQEDEEGKANNETGVGNNNDNNDNDNNNDDDQHNTGGDVVATTTTPPPPVKSYGLEKIAGFQGGTANSSQDKRALMTVLGSRVNVGRLQAAELAFAGYSTMMSSSSSITTPTTTTTGYRKRSQSIEASDWYDDDKSGNQGVELLLCCLSDTGVITTHLIPEALPKKPVLNRRLDFGLRDLSPTRSGPGTVRTAFPTNAQTRVYLEDKPEGTSLLDAAGFWGGANIPAIGVEPTGTPRTDDIRYNPDTAHVVKSSSSTSPQKKQQHLQHQQQPPEPEDPLIPASRRTGDGTFMPFDMEVPVAYGSVTSENMSGIQLGITDMASGAMVSKTALGVVEEVDPVATDGRDTVSFMENIDTERVPCPRLCGATFGMGNGGLVIFHNGEVKKMWNWYQKTDAVRLSGMVGGGGGGQTDKLTSLEPEPMMMNMMMKKGGSSVSHDDRNNIISNDGELSAAAATHIETGSDAGPRTLKELVDMTETAKETQWGETNLDETSASEAEMSAADNFFEDDSLGESSDSDNDNPGSPTTDDLYKKYFPSRAWKGLVQKGEQTGSTVRHPLSRSGSGHHIASLVGPSSDMLAPIVRVTHEYDAQMLSHQKIALAKGWKLGDWRSHVSIDDKTFPSSTDESDRMSSPPRNPVHGLPNFRQVNQTPTSKRQIHRVQSDSNIRKVLSRQQQQSNDNNNNNNRNNNNNNASMTMHSTYDEPGVHGGQYTVRPNREESMTFLKKLFTHQQESGSNFSNLISPPDSPMIHHSTTSGRGARVRSHDGNPLLPKGFSGGTREGKGTRYALGVYTLSVPKKEGHDNECKLWNKIKELCLHNASVCDSVGDPEKGGVWNLLAQTVEGQTDDEGKMYNGWGGIGGGALGVDVVSNLLKYYESLGDVQMLASIYCVLSTGNPGLRSPRHSYLLSQTPEDIAKYDSYIRNYAELLYNWGLLTHRAELNKHLIWKPSNRERDQTCSLIGEEKTDTTNSRQPGIAVVFVCPRCGRDGDFNTNICRTCQNFVFRCAICDNAVRGLFTVCSLCNHGGHVDHMKAWFSKHVECPTGCGCKCTFSSVKTSLLPTSVAAADVENEFR